jgi:pyruvate dehydrogenase E1 component beta subunit
MLSSQHSQAFDSWFANTPGLKVVVPSNPADAKGLLKTSIRDNDPVIFMESELMYGDKGLVPDGEYLIPIGVADVKKQGTDVTIVTFGKMLPRVVMPAVAELEKEGINAEVIDLRSIRPIDYATVVESVKKTNRCVVVEEAWPLGSIATEITYHVQRYAFDYLDAPVIRVVSKDVPLPYAPTLIDEILPTPPKVVKAVKAVLYR